MSAAQAYQQANLAAGLENSALSYGGQSYIQTTGAIGSVTQGKDGNYYMAVGNGQSVQVTPSLVNGSLAFTPAVGQQAAQPASPTSPTVLQIPSSINGAMGLTQPQMDAWLEAQGLAPQGATYPGEPILELPQGWVRDAATNSILINGQPPTPAQTLAYENALVEYRDLGGGAQLQSNNAPMTAPVEPNWYSILQAAGPEYGPAVANAAAVLGITPQTYQPRTISSAFNPGIAPAAGVTQYASSLLPASLQAGASFGTEPSTTAYTSNPTSTIPLLQTRRTPPSIPSSLTSTVRDISSSIYKYSAGFGNAALGDINGALTSIQKTIQQENAPISQQAQSQIASYFPMKTSGSVTLPNISPTINDYMALAKTNPLALIDILRITDASNAEQIGNAIGATVNASPFGYITNPIKSYIAPYLASSDPTTRAEGVAIGLGASFGIASVIAIASAYGVAGDAASEGLEVGTQTLGDIFSAIAKESVRNAAITGGLYVGGGALLEGQTSPSETASNALGGLGFGRPAQLLA